MVTCVLRSQELGRGPGLGWLLAGAGHFSQALRASNHRRRHLWTFRPPGLLCWACWAAAAAMRFAVLDKTGRDSRHRDTHSRVTCDGLRAYAGAFIVHCSSGCHRWRLGCDGAAKRKCRPASRSRASGVYGRMGGGAVGKAVQYSKPNSRGALWREQLLVPRL